MNKKIWLILVGVLCFFLIQRFRYRVVNMLLGSLMVQKLFVRVIENIPWFRSRIVSIFGG
ncbi:hypothetical protein [Aeribacillus pallidus]|uniref:hypothetical protein n=1 Tax=Aeribacillus pallidus TaxID=33936 RepID=UPI003D1FCBD7